MNSNMIPIVVLPVLFGAVAYTIKAVVDARSRTRLLQSNPPELVLSILNSDEQRRRQSGLRWGIVLVCLALGFTAVEFMDSDGPSPGVIAVLLGATGLGNILAYFVSRKIEGDRPPL